MDDCKHNRREFLGRAGAGVAGTSLGLSYPDPTLAKTGEMTMRFLGRSKDKISLIGLGEFHLGKAVDERTAFRIVRTAIDNGITLLGNCWDYQEGKAKA
ncbi:MAG: twin-arginine translocation signal domain-containing protein [Acidobacteria bacterium]|nr:twin-arginine translocation signal domain-containing protein [Acidobacteriota bacterium]